jgi:tetratricopeptide (TPR) repeat protein
VKADERHKLKHDKYAETVVSGLQWAKVHQAKVVAVASVLVIVTGAVVWTIHARVQERQAAERQLSEYEVSADRAVGMKGDARAEAIKNALGQLDGLVKSYPGSDVAPRALLRAAELLSETGEPAKAAGYYERVLEMDGAPEGLKALARRGWAAALEQSGDVERAIVQYKILAGSSAAQEAVEADWDVGRCYELLKDPENAKSFYRKAVESGGDSKWAELARFRVETLALGPTSPEAFPSAVPPRAPELSAPATTSAAPAATSSPAPAATASVPAATAPMPEAAPSAAPTSSPAPESSAPAAAATSSDAQEQAAPK